MNFRVTYVFAAFFAAASIFGIPFATAQTVDSVVWHDNEYTAVSTRTGTSMVTVSDSTATNRSVLSVSEGTQRNSTLTVVDSGQKWPSLAVTWSGSGTDKLYMSVVDHVPLGGRNGDVTWVANNAFCNDPQGADLWRIGGSTVPANTAENTASAVLMSSSPGNLRIEMGPCPDSMREADRKLRVRFFVASTEPTPSSSSGLDPNAKFEFDIEILDDDVGGPGTPGLSAVDGLVFDAGGISINGRTPIMLDEGDAEQILDVTVPYTVPRNHPGGASLDFRLYPSGAAPAVLAALGGRLVCPRPDEPAQGDPDVLVSERPWLRRAGGPTRHVTAPNLDTPGPDGSVTPAVPEPRVAAFRFGLLCHDDRPEPEESFTLEAWFSAGDSTTPTSATIARITDDDSAVPGVPTAVDAFIEPSDGSPVPAVMWEPPAASSPVIRNYQVEYRDSVNRRWGASARLPRNAVAYPHPGSSFVPGRVYSFRVRAGSQGVGASRARSWGPWSAEVSVTFPEDPVPGRPLSVEAFLDGGLPAVTWEAPEPIDGVDVDGYDVQIRTSVDRLWRPLSPCGEGGYPLALKCVAASGSPGVTYEFRVRALDDPIEGPWSASVTVTVPETTVPGVPLNVEAYLRNGFPAVAWEPPLNAVLAGVDGYTVQSRTSANRVWSAVSPCDPPSQAASTGSCVLSVAVPGETYEFRVRALAGSLPGPWSPEASVVVPLVPVPEAPQGLRLEADGLALVATWDEPANVEEAPVQGYRLRLRGTGIDDAWRIRNTAASQLRLHIANLPFERGGTYRAQVRAVGAAGDGPWSAEAQVEIPEAIVPGLPVFDPPRLSAGRVLLSWSAPANAVLARVTRYEVAAWLTVRAEPLASADVAVAGRTDHTVTTIGPGCEFRARVRAVGQHGAGGYARLDPTVLGDAVCDAMRPPAPRGVSASVAGRLATVRWTRGSGDTPVTGFELSAQPRSGSGVPFSASVEDADATSWTSEPLTAGDWRFRVRAAGSDLSSLWSAWSNDVTVAGAAMASVSFDVEATAITRSTHNPAFVVLSEPLAVDSSVVFDSPRRLYVDQLMDGGRPGYDAQGRTPFTVRIEAGRTRVHLMIEPEDTRDPFLPGQVVEYRLSSPEPAGDLAVGHPSAVSCVVGEPNCRPSGTPVPVFGPLGIWVLGAALAALGFHRLRRDRRSGR